MGIFSKLAFWKKKEDFDMGKDFGADLGLGPMDNLQGPRGMPSFQDRGMRGYDPNLAGQDLGLPEDTGFGAMGAQPQYRQPSMQPPGQPAPMQQPFGAPIQPSQPTERDYGYGKDLEVVSAKLDSIRYTLESINQRLANLERVAYGEREERKRW